MRGIVTDMRITVNVVLRLAEHPDFSIECVLDTAFRGALALPPQAVTALNLPHLYDIDANLANNMVQRTPLHSATIVWEGQELLVTVLAMGSRPLLGTALL